MTASAGTLTETETGWSLTLPAADTAENSSVTLSAESRPVFGTATFVMPAALTAIEANAFEGIAASIVDVPDSCTSIGDYAFQNCEHLTQIRIPAGKKKIKYAVEAGWEYSFSLAADFDIGGGGWHNDQRLHA